MINPILLSLKIATVATIIVFIISIIFTKLLGSSTSNSKSVIETVINLPMILPPSVIGYGLLTLLSRNSHLGGFLYDKLQIQIIFTWVAGVIAAVVVSFPLMYQSIKGALLNMEKSYIEAARTMGASEIQIFFYITLPLAWTGVLSGFVLTFARCLGEFGATLMVMGNIPGKTQTIPTAIYFAVETGDQHTANVLVLFITVFSFLITFFLNLYLKKKDVIIK